MRKSKKPKRAFLPEHMWKDNEVYEIYLLKPDWCSDVIGCFILSFAVKAAPYKLSAAGMAVSSFCYVS